MGSATGSSSGMMGQVSLTRLLISSGATLEVFSDGFANGNVSTLMAQPPFDDRKHGRITAVEVDFYSLGNADAKAITLNLFGEGSAGATVFSSAQTFASNKVRYEDDSSGANFPTFNALGVQVAWGAGSGADTATPAKVRRITVYYSPENIT